MAAWSIFNRSHFHASGEIEGNRLTFTNGVGATVQYTFRQDGKVAGLSTGQPSITMSK